MSDAIVLSGGGSRGSFQVGALSCLYQRGIRPTILCGTSVGAINAAKLAEGDDAGNASRGLAGLVAIWASLRNNDDMYVEEAWLRDPKMDPRLADFLVGKSDDLGIASPKAGGPWGDLQVLIDGLNSLGFLLGDGAAVLQSLQVFLEKARGLYNLGPIRQRLKTSFDRSAVAGWAAGGGKLRLATVSLDSGRLRFVTETGALIETSGAPVTDPSRVALVCAPIAQDLKRLADRVTSLTATIRELQKELSMAPPSAKADLVQKIKEAGRELDDVKRQLALKRTDLSACSALNPVPFSVEDLGDGVIASASIPGVFVPVQLGAEYYIDGGIREVIPVQAAVDLDPSTIYAVSASSRQLPAFVTPAAAGALPIVARALESLAIDEIARSDLAVRSLPGKPLPTIRHIEPLVDLHDITTIDPGLIQISEDYGYMRAADTLDGIADEARRSALATEIALLRTRIWRMENALTGHRDPTALASPAPAPDPAKAVDVWAAKAALSSLVAERRSPPQGGPMPADIDQWSGSFELHPWNVDAGTRVSLWQLGADDRQVEFREHGPFNGWTPINADSNALLWKHIDGRISLWSVDDHGDRTSVKEHGPFAGYSVVNLAGGRVLWRRPDGGISLWRVDAGGEKLGFQEHGPFPGWTALSCTANEVFWRHDDGRVSIWTVDEQGNKLQSTDHGPFSGYCGVSFADGMLLWRKADGSISLWMLDGNHARTAFAEYPAIPGWEAVQCGDGRVLWRHVDGRASLWTVDAAGHMTTAMEHGPFDGWRVVSFARGKLVWQRLV